MPNNVGIYIDKNSVDLVQLTYGLQGLKVTNSIRVPIPKPKPDQTQDLVVETIKEAVKKAKLKNASVIAALPTDEVIIRYFQMPILPSSERYKAIIFEAKKYLPFKLDEVIFDFCISEVKEGAKAEDMDVVFAAVRKDSLNQYVTYFTQAGIKLKAVEPAPLSLLRWHKFNSLIAPTTHSMALLELGGDNLSVTITVVKRDIPFFVREITLPEPLIAEKQTEFNKGMLERLLSEIHMSFEYYKKWFQGEKVEKIILFSQTVTPEELTELLAKEIDIPVESGALRKGLKTRGYLSSELYLAAGAALRNKIKSKVKINLYRPPKIGWFEGKKGTQKAIIIEAALACLFLLGLYFIVSGPAKFTQSQLENIISNRPQLEENIDVNSFKALKEAKETLLKRRNLLANLIKNRFYYTPRLSRLVNLVPEGVWLTDVQFNQATTDDISSGQYDLLIKANAFAGKETLGDLPNKFLENLRQDRYFKNTFTQMEITFSKTQTIADTQVIAFEISSSAQALKSIDRRR